MRYREYLPAESLRSLVRCYWTLTDDGSRGAGAPEPALPDGSPELIVNRAEPFVYIATDGSRITQPRNMLVGQITRPFDVVPTGRVDIFAIRFQPHGAALLSEDMARYTNGWNDLDVQPTVSSRRLVDALAHDGQDDEVVARCDTVLADLFADSPLRDDTVAKGVAIILRTHGLVMVDVLAASLGCSSRQLQRSFARQVGISPKQLARIRRFQRVFAAWRDDPGTLSRVAAECGYFDQPHLIRDFHRFAGRAPTNFFANTPAFTQLFLPS